MVRKLTGLGDGVGDDKDDKEPPTRNLLVDLHLLVVLVIDDQRMLVPWVEGNEERLEVVPVVQRDVGDGSTERQVGGDQVERVGGGEPSRTEFRICSRIKAAVLEKGGLVVLSAVGSLRRVSMISFDMGTFVSIAKLTKMA